MGLFSFFRRKQEEMPETEEPVMQQEAPVAAPAKEQPKEQGPILQPYKNDGLNKIYNLLFCDDIELFRSNDTANREYPWNILWTPVIDESAVRKVLTDTKLESRLRVLAANKLLSAGASPSSKELLGVIVEVSLDSGPDVLAAYKDGTARYINHSEEMIVWETPDAMSSDIINGLFAHADAVVEQIGPWDKKRLPYPPKGTVRLTFLVTDGLYFGQAPANAFFNDPMAGPVLNAASQLMVYLMDQAQGKED